MHQGINRSIYSPLENLQKQYYDHNQAMTQQICMTRSRTRREWKGPKAYNHPKSVAYRTRSKTASQDNSKSNVETVPNEKKNTKLYNVKSFINDVEYTYFTPHQQKFWLFYQNVDCEPSFKDVIPVSSKAIKPTDYIYQKNILWEYSRNKNQIPMVNRYRIVK